MQYSADLVTSLLGQQVTVKELQEDPKRSKEMLDKIRQYSRNGKDFNLVFKKRERKVCVGLSEVGEKQLKDAVAAFAALIPASKKLVIPRPSIRL